MIRIHKKYAIILSIIFLGTSFFLLKLVYASTVFLEVDFYKSDKAELTYIQFSEESYDNFFSSKGYGNYSVKILNKDGIEIYSEKFGGLIFVRQATTETGVIEQEIEKVGKNFRLLLPTDSYFIKFYKNNVEILSVKLSDYTCNNDSICNSTNGENSINCPDDCKVEQSLCGNNQCETGETKDNCCKDCGCENNMKCVDNKCVSDSCGNGRCDTGENYGNCSDDCISGLSDGYCDGVKDGLCDPDCLKSEDVDCSNSSSRIWIYAIIGVVICALIFMILTRSRRTE